MTGLSFRFVDRRFAFAVAALVAASGVLIALAPVAATPIGPTGARVWLAWLIGALVLIGFALFEAVEEPGTARRRAFGRHYDGIAVTGMVMSGALLVLVPLWKSLPGDTGMGDYASFAADLLAQLCFGLLVLFAYQATVVTIARTIGWCLGRFAWSTALANCCTPTAIAFVILTLLITATSFYDTGTPRVLWLTLLAITLLGSVYLKRISIRTFSSHLGCLATAVAIFWGITGIGVDVLTSMGNWSPVDIFDLSRSELTGALIYALIGMTATLALALKRSLVLQPTDGTAPASLSIYPDSRLYVGDDGYLARLSGLVLQSDGGVIGVTGLRGAGKSALLGAMMDRFRGERCVVWTTAPVSYQSDDKLSFLMSISRALCQKAIDDAGKVLYGYRSETRRALEEFIRSIRVPVAIGCVVIAGGYFLGAQTSFTGSLLGTPLSMPDRVQLQGRAISLVAIALPGTLPPLRASFEEARVAEVARLSSLLAQMDLALAPDMLAGGDRHAITPIPGEPGFDLVTGSTDRFDVSVLVDRDKWLRQDAQLDALPGMDPDNISLSDSDLWNVGSGTLNLHGLPTAEARRAFAFLQEEFERRVVGNRASILVSDGSVGDINAGFERRVAALAALRGDPRLAPHLEGVNAELRRLLGTDPDGTVARGLITPDWASLALIASFYDAVAVLKDPDATEAVRRTALDRLFLDNGRLKEVRAVLARYVGILEGRTLPANAASPAVAAPGIFSLQRITERTSHLPAVRSAWIVGALLLICLLPEFLRAVNFVARGLLNFRVLVLMRACTEFMELLDYSEGREASSGFAFRGLSLAGKRTLSARNLTLQSLTDRYQEFVRLLLTFYNGKLIVIIDELDKMSDPEQVKSVLLELKGALFQRGCYYLISISEDAASAFRNRMSEGRDIFESTFEDVLSIERMSSGAAAEMVRQRLAGDSSAVPVSAKAVEILRVFAGAIPREIVRHLRETVLAAGTGAAVQPRMIGLDIFRSELLQWRESLKAAPLAGNDLIRLIGITEEIEAMLPSGGKAWPELSSGPASTGVRLAECLAILDPEAAFMAETFDFHALEKQAGPVDPHARKIAEIQSCLRLMTMNELMRHVWHARGLKPEQSEAAVTCLRAIMIQPAVAAHLLTDLAQRILKLSYPERNAAESDAAIVPIALV